MIDPRRKSAKHPAGQGLLSAERRLFLGFQRRLVASPLLSPETGLEAIVIKETGPVRTRRRWGPRPS